MTHNKADADKRMMRMLHHRTSKLDVGDSVAEPLVMTSVYEFGRAPEPDKIYGRNSNPTVEATEEKLAILEGAKTVLFASGMAAYMAVFLATLKAGDRVLVLSDGYYNVRKLLDDVLTGLDITMETCAARDMAAYPLDGITLAIVESPTNPSLDVIDIAAFCTRAHQNNCLVAVDNTVCTPLLQRPLALGADISLASDTKASGGHSDLLLGHVSAHDEALVKKIYDTRTLSGSIAGPFEAWMLARSLETLELRLERMCSNATAVVDILCSHPKIKAVRYPGLIDDPAYHIGHTQMSAPGFLIGVTFASQIDAENFIEASHTIVAATSFGGTHTSADRRARWSDDVEEGFLRLSIGCEPCEALLTAFKGGLAVI
jgi:cystathionine gamma-lyase